MTLLTLLKHKMVYLCCKAAITSKNGVSTTFTRYKRLEL